MRVAELMITDLKTVEPEATVAEAVTSMIDAHISALPVVDGRNRLIGVVSTTDILQAAAEEPAVHDQLFGETLVRDLMTPRPATVGLETDVKEAAQQMLYLEVHRLFVEDEGELVGVISQSDIVRGVAMAKL